MDLINHTVDFVEDRFILKPLVILVGEKMKKKRKTLIDSRLFCVMDYSTVFT